jgi:ComF family protein
MHIADILLDLLFPRAADDSPIFTSPSVIGKEELQKRGLTALDSLYAAHRYDASPELQKAIWRFKYGRSQKLSTILGNLLIGALPSRHFSPPPVLCPVPLHWSRRFDRGFNQSLLLANVVADSKQWEVRELVKRARPTGHQAHRKRSERLSALSGAFGLASTEPLPRSVFLIDDLATTGATLEECARVLKAHGVEFVAGLVIALG